MKIHLNLSTRDLAASVAFYRTLLVAEYVKRCGDYALFLTDDSGIELALDADPEVILDEGAHYGLTVDSPDAVEAAISRLQRAGYAVDLEREETCCCWESYAELDETETRGDNGPGFSGVESAGAAKEFDYVG